jgi:hypothetical protein
MNNSLVDSSFTQNGVSEFHQSRCNGSDSLTAPCQTEAVGGGSRDTHRRTKCCGHNVLRFTAAGADAWSVSDDLHRGVDDTDS